MKICIWEKIVKYKYILNENKSNEYVIINGICFNSFVVGVFTEFSNKQHGWRDIQQQQKCEHKHRVHHIMEGKNSHTDWQKYVEMQVYKLC